MQTDSPKRGVWWIVTGLVLISMVIACTVLYNHSSVEAEVVVTSSSSDFEVERAGRDMHRGGRHNGHPTPVKHDHPGAVQHATPVESTHSSEPNIPEVDEEEFDEHEVGNDEPDETPHHPSRPRPVRSSRAKHHKQPAPVTATNTCFKITATSVNVRNAPCGTVVTSLSLGTVVTGVGSPKSASSCSVGNYQWQQISGAANGYVATTLLQAVTCSTPPPPPPSGGSYHGKGIDLSQPCGNWQCIKDAGYTFAIPRIYKETGSVDTNGAASVRAAAAMGLKTDVYVYPAGFQSNNGVQMANDVINAILGLPVGRVWLDIEGVGKSWPSNTAANQKLFRDLADTFTRAGVAVGVYTQGWQWNSIMGSSFTYGSQFPLWYAEYGQGPGRYTTTDGTCTYSGSSQNFNGFSSFGGWSRPFAKQYNGDCSKCGCGTDANIVP